MGGDELCEGVGGESTGRLSPSLIFKFDALEKGGGRTDVLGGGGGGELGGLLSSV